MQIQNDLFPMPAALSRASARRQALEAAKRRAELGMARAGGAANKANPEWVALAVQRVRAFARANPGLFSIEQMRSVIGPELPAPDDLRAWGKVTVDASAAGFIVLVPKVSIPAASSNGCGKPAWKRGPLA